MSFCSGTGWDDLSVPSAVPSDLERRSQFLLAVKYFELGELSSGQAPRMCDMGRTAFLLEAGRIGIAVAELSPDELEAEFAHA
jgi:hypothetical protein